jgi:hypothetical protein
MEETLYDKFFLEKLTREREELGFLYNHQQS